MYKSNPVEVEIQDGKTAEININLIPTFANAEITCQDKEVEIYIDGEFKAKGSFQGRLEEGTHQFEFKKKSHRTIKRTINALSGQTLTENIDNLQAINGKLNLDSEPYDADIYIDEKHYGKTPNIIPQILIGDHKLTLKKDGFKDLTETINIEEGKIAEYNFTLQKKPIKTLEGHTQFVLSASYSPDGRKIVSASWDHTIKICDANTGRCLQTLTGHSWAVYSASYSPDGRKIVSASNDNTIKIWDANTGECLQTITGHTYAVRSASFSPDGTKIVSASRDNTIKIWGEEEIENFIPNGDFNNNYDYNYRNYDYDNYENERTYGRYGGSYAQDVEGWSDQDIDEVFDGDPDAYWNID
jgi:WD40 repeat protein